MQKLRISISPSMLILLASMIATTPLPKLLACFCAAVLHELGHIAAAKLMKVNLSHMKLDVLGARLTTTEKLSSYPAMLVLCGAGPFVNILCYVLLRQFTDSSEWIYEFCFSSLSLGIVNLIPVQGFDGSRIIHSILSILLPVHFTERVCTALGFCSLLCMWLLSVWMLLRTGTSLTLFVFSCSLFGMLFV